MRPSRDETWLNVAREIARRSTCLRRAVGCVLVDARGHVLSTGHNGVAAGRPHCNEGVRHYDGRDEVTGEWLWKYPNACAGAAAPSGARLDDCEAVHAEANALLQCRDPFEIDVCYVTVSPCVPCAKLLLNTSCARVVFLEEYAGGAAARELFAKDGGRRWELLELRNGDKQR